MTFPLKSSPIPTDYNELKDSHVLLKKQHELLLQEYNYACNYFKQSMRAMQKELFARSAESVKYAFRLFDEAEFNRDIEEKLATIESAPPPEVEETIVINPYKRKKPKRTPLPEHFPREEVVHDLKEEDKTCPHDQTPLHRMGEDVFEELHYQPAQYKVIRHITPKYACRHCEDQIIKALMPKRLISKSYVSSSLLANIAVNKYHHHLPLHRQEQILASQGIKIPETTMSDWVLTLGEQLLVMMNLMWEDMFKTPVIQCDETPLQVLNVGEDKKNKITYMWVACRWQKDIKIILYEYDPTRKSSVPLRLFQDYKGYLQVDGYQGYNAVTINPDIIRMGCMAHLRRYFVKALDDLQKSERHLHPAAQIETAIKQLYLIEESIRDYSTDARLEARNTLSRPIFEKIKSQVSKDFEVTLPKTLYGKALGYARKELPYISKFLESGHLEIDNNRVENCIRPFALGKKNWLFSNTEKGAKASANIYSIIHTAKANGWNPEEYLKILIEKLPNCQVLEDYENLLPYRLNKPLEC